MSRLPLKALPNRLFLRRVPFFLSRGGSSSHSQPLLKIKDLRLSLMPMPPQATPATDHAATGGRPTAWGRRADLRQRTPVGPAPDGAPATRIRPDRRRAPPPPRPTPARTCGASARCASPRITRSARPWSRARGRGASLRRTAWMGHGAGACGACVTKTRKRHAVREMKVGPSKSPWRGRLQTARSCCGQKPWW